MRRRLEGFEQLPGIKPVLPARKLKNGTGLDHRCIVAMISVGGWTGALLFEWNSEMILRNNDVGNKSTTEMTLEIQLNTFDDLYHQSHGLLITWVTPETRETSRLKTVQRIRRLRKVPGQLRLNFSIDSSDSKQQNPLELDPTTLEAALVSLSNQDQRKGTPENSSNSSFWITASSTINQYFYIRLLIRVKYINHFMYRCFKIPWIPLNSGLLATLSVWRTFSSSIPRSGSWVLVTVFLFFLFL